MIRFGAEICQDLKTATKREWLETNGLGGFASSTIIGMNTRRYHALLTAALEPPVDRKVLLSKLEETLILNGKRYELSTNQYPGALHPTGYLLQSTFRLDPFPVFTWLVEDIELHKTVFMIHGENGVVVQYLLRAQGAAARHECQLELRPFIAFRDFHQTTHANSALNAYVETRDGRASVKPYPDLPALHFAHDAEKIVSNGGWFFNFEYSEEAARGLDYHEDLFNPFTMSFDLSRRIQATVIASTERHAAADAANFRISEINRRKALRPSEPFGFAADQFIVDRASGKSVIAGYHWFGDWGRDTMIALPGLTLATGRPEIAREILLEFTQYVSEGMLPNRFPDRGEKPEYNTVDATLWYFEAVRALLEATGDYAFVLDRLFGVMEDIIAWHEQGTRYNIHVQSDGLLHSGDAGTQLTWMDAKVGDWVVTNRSGKAVEVQALWYNALCVMHDLALRKGASAYGARPYEARAAQAKASFAPLFWNESAGCLYDVIGDTGPDASIRPNQLVAVGLANKIFDDGAKTLRILDVVERELLTPYGLRTLSPRDPRYRGHYGGDPATRDSAYHQGTVWPWPIYYFLAAYLDAHGRTPEALEQAAKWLAPLRALASDRGLGQIPEIFDGDAPHEPRGCIAQAWSVAEVLRSTVLLA
jgi:predicted glycogen debranching enzyme